MKKIDKLIITSFLGPFILTFLVVVFILLTVHMLRYFDDIMGKGLGFEVIGPLFFYFAVFVTPQAIPLAVLLSSLMTFGNLGEHFELTAIKSAGISLVRTLLPIFIFVLGLTVFAFYSNNYFVPKAALEAYSLLYDIKQKKPALDLKQGAFYNGIPDLSIKVDKKHPDGKTIEDVIIYDHRNQNGNKKVTLADSGIMYTVMNDRYLKLELFKGNFYIENNSGVSKKPRSKAETLSRSSFSHSEYVLDLSSFALDSTDKSLFAGNRIMRNLVQLNSDVDSISDLMYDRKITIFDALPFSFYYHLRDDTLGLPEYLSDYKYIKDSMTLSKLKEEKRIADLKADSLREISDKIAKDSVFKDSLLKALEGKDLPSSGKTTEDFERESKIQELESTIISMSKGSSSNSLRQKLKKNVPKEIGLPEGEMAKFDLNEGSRIIQPKKESIDIPPDPPKKNSITPEALIDSLDGLPMEKEHLKNGITLARQSKQKLQSSNDWLKRKVYERDVFEIQWHKILANSIACIVMFLIGAPLGAIIKKGGLGVPVLISIVFFILFYVISLTGEKWAKRDEIEPLIGIWSANLILFPLGLFFLRQARNDVRLLEADFYNVIFGKIKSWLIEKKLIKPRQIS